MRQTISKEENVRYLRKFLMRTRILNVNNKKTQELILMSIKFFLAGICLRFVDHHHW